MSYIYLIIIIWYFPFIYKCEVRFSEKMDKYWWIKSQKLIHTEIYLDSTGSSSNVCHNGGENPTHSNPNIFFFLSSPHSIFPGFSISSSISEFSNVSRFFPFDSEHANAEFLDSPGFGISFIFVFWIKLISTRISRSEKVEIWSVRRIMEWRPCDWWLQGKPAG